jgi:multiple sugar transport system substrate-binding protein
MKKRIGCLLILPLAFSIVSCGTTTSSYAASVDDGYKDYTPFINEDTTIDLWSITGSNNQAQLQAYVDGFMAIEPHVKVNNVIQTGMDYNGLKDAVEKGFSANNYPDLVQCYPDHVAEYIDYGKAVNLDPYITNADYGFTADDKVDYISNFLDEGKEYTVSGTYSVPYCKSTELMFYNEDVLLGLNLSKFDSSINGGKALNQNYFDNLTWEELFNHLCPAIVAYNDTLDDTHKILKTDQAYHSVFAYDSDDNLFITLAQQYGYGYTSVDAATGKGSVDFDNDGMKSLMKTFHDAADKGYIISKGSAGDNYTNTYFTAQNTLFSVGSTGGVKYQFADTNPMNVGVARIPHAAGKNPYVINQGPSLVMLDHNDANRKLASWLFYKFMTNATNSLDWAVNSGYMGIRHSNYVNEAYVTANDVTTKDAKTLDRLMAKSNTYTQNILSEMYTSPAFKGSSTCRTQGKGLMTWALLADSNMSDIDTKFATAVNQCKLAM